MIGVLLLVLPSLVQSVSWDIYIPETTFDLMENCSFEEYKSDNRPDKCDYQDAKCSFNHEDAVDCEVRRKGSGSWRHLREKPSFKIKHMKKGGEDYHFGDFDCSKINCNPSSRFSGVNSWRTEKVTLNNGVQHTLFNAEVKAYDVFRKLGVVSPLAQMTTLSLYRGNALIRRDTYTMIETINDKAFMKKYYGDDYALWEIDKGIEFERDGGSLKDVNMTGINLLALSIDQVHRDRMIAYYVGERLTKHFDGACMGNQIYNIYQNHYIALDGSGKFSYIPSGVDNVFTCVDTSDSVPHCTPMNECWNNTECKREYDSFLADYGDMNVPSTCVSNMWIWISGGVLIVLIILLIIKKR